MISFSVYEIDHDTKRNMHVNGEYIKKIRKQYTTPNKITSKQ